jgi:hypothetical protein
MEQRWDTRYGESVPLGIEDNYGSVTYMTWCDWCDMLPLDEGNNFDFYTWVMLDKIEHNAYKKVKRSWTEQ